MKKSLVGILLSAIVIVTSNNVYAQDEDKSITEIVSNTITQTYNQIKPQSYNPTIVRKSNVKTYTEYSAWKTVSGTVNTGKYGGSITSGRSHTFTVIFSGTISGLGISTSYSFSTDVGHTINVGPNKKAYMEVRVKYKVETGRRELYDTELNRVISSNNYTVKTPINNSDEYRVKYI